MSDEQPTAAQPRNTEEREKVTRLQQQFGEARQARAPYEGAWYLNVAFFSGDQWLGWDGRKLFKPSLRADRVLITDNRIQPAIRTEIAKMTKTRPGWDATPDSPDEKAVEAARLAERAMDSHWETLNMRTKLRRALEWSRICGAGFWKVTHDSSVGKGRDVIVTSEGKVMRDEQQAPMPGDALDGLLQQLPPEAGAMLTRKTVREGSARIDVRSPFQMFPDPLAESWEECEFVFEETVQSPAYVKQHYGVELKPDTSFTAGAVEARMGRSAGGASAVRTPKKGVTVRELWTVRQDGLGNAQAYPKGRHAVWADNRVLLDEANPYHDDDGEPVLPYVMFSGIPVPGRFWPTSVAEQLRPVQVELNKVKSQKAENRNRFGNPTLLRSKQANVKYTGVPGEIVDYDDTTQNALPTFLQPPELPGYVQAELAEMQESIREISGQHEVSAGSVPAGVTAASAINLLQEQDDTRLGPAIEDMEASLSRGGQMLLRIFADYYSDERLLKLTGDDDRFEVFRFRGQAMKGVPALRVTEGSMKPRSQAAKQALMHDTFNLMIQYGIRFEERALRKFFQQYEVGGLESLLGDLDRDEQQMNREHRRLYAGDQLEPNELVDNHLNHIAGHREEMKSTRYEEACRQDSTLKARFEAHLKRHLDFAAALSMPGVDPNANAAAPDTPGGAPVGPGQPTASNLNDFLSQMSGQVSETPSGDTGTVSPEMIGAQ